MAKNTIFSIVYGNLCYNARTMSGERPNFIPEQPDQPKTVDPYAERRKYREDVEKYGEHSSVVFRRGMIQTSLFVGIPLVVGGLLQSLENNSKIEVEEKPQTPAIEMRLQNCEPPPNPVPEMVYPNIIDY